MLSVVHMKKGIHVDYISLGDTPAFLSFMDNNQDIFFLQLNHLDKLDNLDEVPKSQVLNPAARIQMDF